MHPNADNLIATRFDTVIYNLDGTYRQRQGHANGRQPVLAITACRR
jgi:hypothetical protein